MEQIDTLLNGNKILQDKERFMFGIDAVLLSYFTSSEIQKGDKVIDLGTGTGIIPLLLESSSTAAHITGVEIQEESASMARRSVEMNNLQGKISIEEGDIKKIGTRGTTFDENKTRGTAFDCHGYQIVTSNPPYMICEHGKKNLTDAKSIARHEVYCNFEDVVSAADYLLAPHGKFFLIHKPFRLPELFTTLIEHGLEPKRMRMITPSQGKEPNIVLIEARKNAKPRLTIEPELIVYKNKGEYSDEVQQIYESFKQRKV